MVNGIRRRGTIKMMKRVSRLNIFCIFVFLVFASRSYPGDPKNDEITIVFPAQALSSAVRDILPIKLVPNDKISGDVWIDSVSDLKFEKNKVFCSMSLRGKGVKYTFYMQKAPVIVEIGDVDIALSLQGTFRFEKAHNRLYVTPTIVGDDTGPEKGSPVELLMSVLAGVEYPVEIHKVEPIIAKLSGQKIRIEISLLDIFSDDNKLFFTVRPKTAKT